MSFGDGGAFREVQVTDQVSAPPTAAATRAFASFLVFAA